MGTIDIKGAVWTYNCRRFDSGGFIISQCIADRLIFREAFLVVNRGEDEVVLNQHWIETFRSTEHNPATTNMNWFDIYLKASKL